MDLLDRIKKNKTVKYLVIRNCVEEVTTIRTVNRISEVMAKKYAKTLGEKIQTIINRYPTSG